MAARGVQSLVSKTLAALLAGAALLPMNGARAAPPGPAALARLASGQSLQVLVEFDTAAVDQAALQERRRRGLVRDDTAVSQLRVNGYARIKAAVAAAVTTADAAQEQDYTGLPLVLWRVRSPAALARLRSQPGVRAVHENRLLRIRSVSDLSFIHQPQAAAQGAAGAGTIIAVIDGGLGDNYRNYSDFGTCSDVNTPSDTCRVRYVRNYYSDSSASHETGHGTNVSAIALGVAPGAKLAMYNVFGWFEYPAGSGTYVSGAYDSDVLNAMNRILTSFNATTFNVVAVNMSLGDGASNSSPCAGSVYASAVTQLANKGIAAVAAAGNSGDKSGLEDPACAPGVVSVGAVYSAPHSAVTWASPASCTESGAPDQVACFSQSASYLTLLAPGLFVDAPDAGFEESGTSQATPHVTGSIAVLRARYPAEPLDQTVQRLSETGISDADPNGGRILPRMDLLAAVQDAARVELGASGPTQAVAGQTADYALSVSNQGALIGTGIVLKTTLPAGTTILSVSTGCSAAGVVVTCTLGSLAPAASAAFSIHLRWGFSGAVDGSVTLQTDQLNRAATQQLSLGPVGDGASGDGPMPPWANLLLAAALLAGLLRIGGAPRLLPG